RVPGDHPEARATLEAIPADEAGLLVAEVPEARHVEVARLAVVEGWLGSDELLDQPGHPGPHHVLAEVVADVAARVPDPVWMLSRLGEQHQPRALERRRREDHDLRFRLVRLQRLRIDERDTA